MSINLMVHNPFTTTNLKRDDNSCFGRNIQLYINAINYCVLAFSPQEKKSPKLRAKGHLLNPNRKWSSIGGLLSSLSPLLTLSNDRHFCHRICVQVIGSKWSSSPYKNNKWLSLFIWLFIHPLSRSNEMCYCQTQGDNIILFSLELYIALYL